MSLTKVARGSARYGLYGWGRFDFSLFQQPADGTPRAGNAVETLPQPTLLATFDADPVLLKAGCKHAGMVMQGKSTQTLATFGLNTSGQLGVLPPESDADREKLAWTRHDWALPAGTRVHSLSLGRQHSLALIQDQTGSRKVWAAGSNHFGQSLAPTPSHVSAWRAVPLPLSDVVQVRAGFDHTVLLHATGEVSSAGWSADGQTGQGHTNTFTPWLPLLRAGSGGSTAFPVPIGRILTGADHTLAVGATGVWAWGNSEYGQCGTGKVEDRIPAPVAVGVGKPAPGEAAAAVRVVDAAVCATSSILALTPCKSAPAAVNPTAAGTGNAKRSLRYFGFESPGGRPVDLPPNVAPDGEWTLVSTHHHKLALHTTRRVFTGRTKWDLVFTVPDAGERLRQVAIGTEFGLAITELQ
ncbi:Williams-Beuren syndrome chromosome region 16 protein [Blastocladiella emersonii ATCC 22665]|nr:Williams-Beuren syndrome chromosome region 16 protein [Blastocladiella emersonii ATCC 22665]